MSDECTRRNFLTDVGQVALGGAIAVSLPNQWASADSLGTDAAPLARDRGFKSLRLRAARLDEMKDFYETTFGFTNCKLTKESLAVQTGGTHIEFVRESAPDAEPYYHVAWAIPSNKFQLAKQWLSQRTRLLKDARGRDEVFFDYANRRGAYFLDPAGNLLELIARLDLGDVAPGPFTVSDFLYVNHVGLAVSDVVEEVKLIRNNLGLELRRPASPNFATLGDRYRHLTLVNTGRLWIPRRIRKAGVFAVQATLSNPTKATYRMSNYPYELSLG